MKRLFHARDSNMNVSDSHHLAGMIALMGLPPKEMLQSSEYAMKFFDSDGKILCFFFMIWRVTNGSNLRQLDRCRRYPFHISGEPGKQFARYTKKFVSLLHAKDASVETGESIICERITGGSLAEVNVVPCASGLVILITLITRWFQLRNKPSTKQ